MTMVFMPTLVKGKKENKQKKKQRKKRQLCNEINTELFEGLSGIAKYHRFDELWD